MRLQEFVGDNQRLDRLAFIAAMCCDGLIGCRVELVQGGR